MSAEVSLDQAVAELGERSAGAYSLGAWRSPVSAHQYRWLVGTLGRIGPVGSILDWGSGDGFFSYWLVRNGYRVTALDLRPPTVTLTDVGPGTFVFVPAADPKQLPFADGTFDLVTSVGVIEHVRETGGDDMYSMREIGRVLRPGGRFVCAHLPNRYSLIEAVARRWFPGRHSHPFRYRASDVDVLAAEAGLHVLERTRYGALPRNETRKLPPAWLGRQGFIQGFDQADRALEAVFSPVVQNFGFVAEK